MQSDIELCCEMPFRRPTQPCWVVHAANRMTNLFQAAQGGEETRKTRHVKVTQV